VDRLRQLLSRRLVDAVVVDVRDDLAEPSLGLIPQYPRIPFFAIAAFRPGDAGLVRSCRQRGVVGVLVEGVDNTAAGEVIAAQSATRRRRDALAEAPKLLRLTEPIQHRAWEEVLVRAGTRTTTTDVARAVRRTREHLSREFGAGGAPNLKRVIDLVRIAWAADLLANPGYSVGDVARLLRFASPSHLSDGAKRVAGVRPDALATLGPEGVLRRFARGRTRSRM
jgi:AraC-like DNA-binding protein